MSTKDIRAFCPLDAAGQELVKTAMNRLNLSARAFDRILKVARTIADIAGSVYIAPQHIGEADSIPLSLPTGSSGTGRCYLLFDIYAGNTDTSPPNSMKYISFSAFALCIFLLNPRLVSAQDSTGASSFVPGVRYGAFGLLSRYYYTADFQSLPGVPSCCPRFQTGEGNGIAAGVILEIPYDDSFGFSAGLGYFPLKGTLSRDENTTVILDGGARQGVFRHSVTISSDIIALQPAVQLNPFEHFWLRGGLSVGFAINTNYSQEERIVQPATSGTFADSGNDTSLRIRNQFSGAITGAHTIIAAPFVSAFYNVPLNAKNTLFLTPQIQYDFPTNNLISDVESSERRRVPDLALHTPPTAGKLKNYTAKNARLTR